MTRHEEEVVAAAVAEQARRDREAIGEYLGVPVNPDTGQPFPTASRAQLDLVEELCGRLGRADDPADTIRQALVEAVVRQHGRTLRACVDDLREHAQLRDDNARYALASLTEAPAPIDGDAIARAYRSGIEAHTLRNVVLRGFRA